MSSYRRLWWVVILTSGLPSASLGVAMSPIFGVVVIVTGLGLVAGVGGFFASQSGPCWRELACAGVLVVAAGPALGGVTVPLLLLAGATSPSFVWAASRRTSASDATPSVITELTSAQPGDVEAFLSVLDGRALCELWGSSFVGLKSARTADERAAAAALRGSLLDEMERRNSGGFAAWLARSPSPVNGPSWWTASPPDGRRSDE
jgi:hypothetical protein